MAAAPKRLGYLDSHLSHSNYLLAEFSVADATLMAVLNWARHIRRTSSPTRQSAATTNDN
jgi:glutathione S-transferase